MNATDQDASSRFGISSPLRWIILCGLAIIVLIGGLWWLALRPDSPPPLAVASDPILTRGVEVYRSNCANCHGELGRGDGPLSKTISGPSPRDFHDEWKYGSEASDALRIVREGAPDSAMPAWKAALSESDQRAVTAYVFYLAGRPIPESLR